MLLLIRRCFQISKLEGIAPPCLRSLLTLLTPNHRTTQYRIAFPKPSIQMASLPWLLARSRQAPVWQDHKLEAVLSITNMVMSWLTETPKVAGLLVVIRGRWNPALIKHTPD